MASKRQRGDSWEFIVKRAGLLEKPLYLTFATEEQGEAYCRRLESLLDRGIVPEDHKPPQRVLTIQNLIDQYSNTITLPKKDKEALSMVGKMVGTVPLAAATANWSDDWITSMKREHRWAPDTIRSRVGALARCLDWGSRKGYVAGANPLRTLREGYAVYTEVDAAFVLPKRDISRDRRLEEGEEERIVKVIEGLDADDKAEMLLIFRLALETAMRLSELYSTTPDQVNLEARAIFLERTKNGDSRSVPLSSVAVEMLKDFKGFPWLAKFKGHRKNTTNHLSKRFHDIFDIAHVDDFHFHDTRHEATSRLFERTTLSVEEVMKITGHKTHRMMMRYLKLRPTTLASKLW